MVPGLARLVLKQCMPGPASLVSVPAGSPLPAFFCISLLAELELLVGLGPHPTSPLPVVINYAKWDLGMVAVVLLVVLRRHLLS